MLFVNSVRVLMTLIRRTESSLYIYIYIYIKLGRRCVTEYQSRRYKFFPRHRKCQISRLINIHCELLDSYKRKERLTLLRRLWEVHVREKAQSNWTVWDQVLTYMRDSCRQTKSHFAHIRTNPRNQLRYISSSFP